MMAHRFFWDVGGASARGRLRALPNVQENAPLWVERCFQRRRPICSDRRPEIIISLVCQSWCAILRFVDQLIVITRPGSSTATIVARNGRYGIFVAGAVLSITNARLRPEHARRTVVGLHAQGSDRVTMRPRPQPSPALPRRTGIAGPLCRPGAAVPRSQTCMAPSDADHELVVTTRH